jgi:hypothetical protein
MKETEIDLEHEHEHERNNGKKNNILRKRLFVHSFFSMRLSLGRLTHHVLDVCIVF